MAVTIHGREVFFVGHCHDRMAGRKITEDEVYAVLEARDRSGITTTAKRGRLNIWGTVKGRRIRVTVEERPGFYNVVTVTAPDEDDND